MRAVNIVGRAPGYEKCGETPGEIWVVSSVFEKLNVAPDKIFELHDDYVNSWEGMKDILVVLNPARFPCEVLPAKLLLKEFGPRFASSISWMIGYAIISEFERINIFGVQMISPREYYNERASLYYMIGQAEARGVQVWTQPGSTIKLNFEYGRVKL